MPCPCAPPPVQITHVNDHFTNSHSRPGEKQFAPQQPSARGEGERRTSTFEKDCEQDLILMVNVTFGDPSNYRYMKQHFIYSFIILLHTAFTKFR